MKKAALLGGLAESRAAKYLERCGYKILARNFRTIAGEIDIVAKHKGRLCFVEVRMRAGEQTGRAEETITSAKRERIAKAALHYVATHKPCLDEIRFDVVAMTNDDISLITDAWRIGD